MWLKILRNGRLCHLIKMSSLLVCASVRQMFRFRLWSWFLSRFQFSSMFKMSFHLFEMHGSLWAPLRLMCPWILSLITKEDHAWASYANGRQVWEQTRGRGDSAHYCLKRDFYYRKWYAFILTRWDNREPVYRFERCSRSSQISSSPSY